MAWKVALMKVEFTEEEYSLHPTVADAMAAAGELEKFLGIDRAPSSCMLIKCSPVTGEYFLVKIVEVDNG